MQFLCISSTFLQLPILISFTIFCVVQCSFKLFQVNPRQLNINSIRNKFELLAPDRKKGGGNLHYPREDNFEIAY